MKIHLISLVGLLSLACTAHAELKLPSIISDHMVLQADKLILLWGWAVPESTVTVSFKGITASTQSDAQGKWSLELAPMQADSTPTTMTISTDHDSEEISDVLVGEVWLCGGQSNMEMKLQNVQDGLEDCKKADYPDIRIFEANRRPNIKPQEDVKGRWQVVSPSTIREFSAVAYYFGRDLHTYLGVPVGLISSNRGGTPAQAWMPLGALQSNPDFEPYLEELEEDYAMFPDLDSNWDEHYDAMIATHKAWKDAENQWQRLSAEAKAATPRPKWSPILRLRKAPTIYYNSNIIPLAPFAIRGVIWYQGEANGNSLQDAKLYRALFPAMIASWRQLWGEELPFYFVQLPGFAGKPGLWMTLRESQLETWRKTPGTGMAVTIDVGNPQNIHPKNKLPVGLRLARIARAQVYGEDIAYSGPLFQKMTLEDDKVRLYFDYTGEGLVAADGELAGFEIAGSDGIYHSAEAEISGDTVLVWSAEIPNPVSVRYAWSDVPVASLWNKSGLPASPFRTNVAQ